jgi:hypothetical protein
MQMSSFGPTLLQYRKLSSLHKKVIKDIHCIDSLFNFLLIADEQLRDRLHPPHASTSADPPHNGKPFRPPPKPTYLFFRLSKLGIQFNTWLDNLFKSELRKRLFVTVALMFAVRGGYYIPLPGFDRRFHSLAMDLVSGTMCKSPVYIGSLFFLFLCRSSSF